MYIPMQDLSGSFLLIRDIMSEVFGHGEFWTGEHRWLIHVDPNVEERRRAIEKVVLVERGPKVSCARVKIVYPHTLTWP
jgi:hypothetical protein